jgi:predicted membrane protein
MAPLTRDSSLRRGLALVLAVSLSACTTWRPALMQSERVIAQRPSDVRVSLERGQQYELLRPRISGGYVYGYEAGRPHRSRIGIPVQRIQTVERRAFSPLRTLSFVGAVTVTGIVLVAALQASRAPVLKVRL